MTASSGSAPAVHVFALDSDHLPDTPEIREQALAHLERRMRQIIESRGLVMVTITRTIDSDLHPTNPVMVAGVQATARARLAS